MFVPKYSITNQILKNIGITDASREVIMNAALIPAWEAKFRKEAAERMIHHGTHLEGNPLSEEEVKDVLDGQDVIARDRDIQEILNYREVLKFIDTKKDDPITDKIFLEIHILTTKKILPTGQTPKYFTF